MNTVNDKLDGFSIFRAMAPVLLPDGDFFPSLDAPMTTQDQQLLDQVQRLTGELPWLPSRLLSVDLEITMAIETANNKFAQSDFPVGLLSMAELIDSLNLYFSNSTPWILV